MNVNAEACLQLDKIIHERGRMGIMSLLAANPELSFTEIKRTLEMTDGNLSVHIRTLQGANYIAVSKSFLNNRPLTTCRLTAKGKRAFKTYLTLLEKIVSQTRS